MFRRLADRVHRISIGVRLGVLMGGLLTLVIAALGLGGILLQQRLMKAAVHRETRRLAESLEGSLRTQMLHGTARTADAVARITRTGGVEAVTVINHRGTIRYATEQGLVGRLVPRTDPRCAACHPGGRRATRPATAKRAVIRDEPHREVATAIVPIRNAPSCSQAACHVHRPEQKVLGVLTVQVPYRSSARAIRSFRNWLLLGGTGLVVFVFAVVVLLLRRWVTRPVAELVAGTQTVARGDLSHTIPDSEAELGELSRAFNRMQKKLLASQQQLMLQEVLASMGKLAAGVAHEINNPLTGVLTYAEALYEDAAEDDPLREDYELILQETLRCREIVKSLLDFGRQTSTRKRKVSPTEIVQRPVRLVRKHPEFHDVHIEVTMDPGLPPLKGDSSKLQQVVLNLLLNAAQAMPDGGQITVAGRHDVEAGAIELAFTDTGTGIAAEDLERIFEPFFSTKQEQGSGIGLAVCRTIVEQHDGRLDVESTPGKGSTFRIVLPAAGDATA